MVTKKQEKKKNTVKGRRSTPRQVAYEEFKELSKVVIMLGKKMVGMDSSLKRLAKKHNAVVTAGMGLEGDFVKFKETMLASLLDAYKRLGDEDAGK